MKSKQFIDMNDKVCDITQSSCTIPSVRLGISSARMWLDRKTVKMLVKKLNKWLEETK